MSATKKKWSELSAGQRALVLTGASVELALTTVAAIDLVRRPASQVRGSKALWALALVVQPVGPLAYLIAHRSGRTAIESADAYAGLD